MCPIWNQSRLLHPSPNDGSELQFYTERNYLHSTEYKYYV